MRLSLIGVFFAAALFASDNIKGFWKMTSDEGGAAKGIVAIYDIKRHPDRHGMGRAIFGLVMGAIFTLLMVFALVAGALSGFK